MAKNKYEVTAKIRSRYYEDEFLVKYHCRHQYYFSVLEINENGEVIDEFWYDEGTITYMRRRLKEYRKRLGIKKFARVNIDNFFERYFSTYLF